MNLTHPVLKILGIALNKLALNESMTFMDFVFIVFFKTLFNQISTGGYFSVHYQKITQNSKMTQGLTFYFS